MARCTWCWCTHCHGCTRTCDCTKTCKHCGALKSDHANADHTRTYDGRDTEQIKCLYQSTTFEPVSDEPTSIAEALARATANAVK